jgi:hypothetical protein
MSREQEIDRVLRAILPPKFFRYWARKSDAEIVREDGALAILAPLIRHNFRNQIIRHEAA